MKKIRKLLMVAIACCTVVLSTYETVHAQILTQGMNFITEIEDFEEIGQKYGNADGKYVRRVSEDVFVEYDLKSEVDPNSVGVLRAASSTSTYTATHVLTTSYKTTSGKVIWSNKITGKFGYNGKQVWGKSGVASFSTDCGSTYTYTKNTYSSTKVGYRSYYRVNTTIKTKSYGTFYLVQSVYCDVNGNTDFYDDF